MAGRNLFTPNRSTRTSARVLIHVSDEDYAKMPGRGRWGPVEVTDLDSGAVLRIRSAPCGGGCHCAAEIVKMIQPGHTALIPFIAP